MEAKIDSQLGPVVTSAQVLEDLKTAFDEISAIVEDRGDEAIGMAAAVRRDIMALIANLDGVRDLIGTIRSNLVGKSGFFRDNEGFADIDDAINGLLGKLDGYTLPKDTDLFEAGVDEDFVGASEDAEDDQEF